MRTISMLVCLISFFTAQTAIAGLTKVPGHINKDGQYVHGHVKTTESLSDTDPKYWANFEQERKDRSEQVKSSPPFNQIYVPPTEGKLEFYDKPELSDYTNDPFDTN